MMDRAINLLVAFDSDEREAAFMRTWRPKLHGHGELGFGLRLLARYAVTPWNWGELRYLLRRKRELFPALQPASHMHGRLMHDRTVVFSRAVWKFWGSRQMVIPDVSTSAEKFVAAVERGNAVCRKYFKHYTLYCV